jgi:phage/conjugal plasmid C-4 type zinc finger TraR family protein
MTCVSDQATELEERMRAEALARLQAEAQERADSGAAGNSLQVAQCRDCGDPIPQKRQKAAPGCTRCLGCEKTDAARRKLGRR